ncbi:MAG TPA: hypothetical protein VLU46_15080 [Thermoanaerobaculia bacterium]|nr:hypothetical protein [Thermoanaerobaculia bacterium]
MRWHHAFLSAVILFAASCASAPRALVPASPLTRLGAPGPYRVREYDLDWFDAKRQRAVPVHIYAPEGAPGPSPVVIFSHGLGNSRRGYRYLGVHWASHGFVSVHPEHIGANEETNRHGLWFQFWKGFDRTNWMNVPLDIRFVIDQLQNADNLPDGLRLDTAHIAVAGHSLGAYAALAVGGLNVLFPDGTVRNFRDPRVTAAIPISMSENFKPSSYRDVAIPMLHITGTRDSSIFYGTWPRKRRMPYNSIPRPDQYLVVIRGANHSTFSDDEDANNRTAHDVVRVTTVDFLDAYLRGDANALASLRNGQLAAGIRPAARFSVKPQNAVRVGSIKVATEPLFSSAEASHGGFYRGANWLATRTRESLVRTFLVVREGEPFDEAKVRESERNLRTLDFLKSVAITASEPHDGVVDLVVATQDAFTTDVNIDFSNDGGRSIYDLDVTQKDLFGRGGEVDVRIASLRERRTRSVEYLTPALFGRYWSADALYAKSSDGDEEKLALTRPLFSYSTSFTLDTLADRLRQATRIYANGQVASLFAQEHRALTLLPGFAVASRPGSTTRILGGVDVVQDRFTPIRGIAPVNRDFRFAEIGIDTTSLRFIGMTHVNLGLKEEDFTLGTHASLLVGRSVGNVWRFTSDASFGHAFSPTMFATTRLSATTRAHWTNRNAIVSSDSWFVKQWALEHPNTLVIRNRIDVGRDVDRDVQFFADGQNGLRAYPNFAFAGTRRFVFNAEDRWYLGHEVLQIVEPGIAAFVDVGGATNRSLFNDRLHTDFGLGLRFGIARYESAMLRFDWSYAPGRGTVFSFATAQAF